MKTLSGSCLCGNVQIEIPDEFEYMGNCHCSECRKFTGSDYSSVGGISSEKFRVISGAESIGSYAKTETTELGFCKCCGSSLYSRKLKTGMHNIRLGILNDPPTQRPGFHIHTASKAPWHSINDDLKQFEQGPN